MAVTGRQKVPAGKVALRKRTNLVDVTVPSGQNFVILALGELPAQTVASADANVTLGTVVAYSAGFGAHALDEVAGLTAISPRSLQVIVEASTRRPILSGGKRVFGLFQSENATNGHTLTDTTPNRAQISLVRFNATGDGLEAAPVADVEDVVFQFEGFERSELKGLDEIDFSEGVFEDAADTVGVTESAHEDLDTLVHNIAENSFSEFVYTGSKLTRMTVWTSPGMTVKIRESTFTYAGSKLTQSVSTQFDAGGSAKDTVTTTYAYTGSKLTGSTMVKS